MPKNLAKTLAKDYPNLRFKLNCPRFSYQNGTIYISEDGAYSDLQTLHELGHALCGHSDFNTHIKRLKLEREAWDMAKTLCKKYHVTWNDAYVESCLDTYRDWLHTKSKCKNCGLTRYQDSSGTYHCPRCETFVS
ncbi:hypothetical protein IKD60_01065 [Candidatus Saccharibacteria bacterium]|nr:hypothetical protein [Candidatus Saccharibacteria bacterium]